MLFDRPLTHAIALHAVIMILVAMTLPDALLGAVVNPPKKINKQKRAASSQTGKSTRFLILLLATTKHQTHQRK